MSTPSPENSVLAAMTALYALCQDEGIKMYRWCLTPGCYIALCAEVAGQCGPVKVSKVCHLPVVVQDKCFGSYLDTPTRREWLGGKAALI